MSTEIDKSAANALTGTKKQIVEAALETLKTKGYASTSAREIARTGAFNQALIFYHFGSVRELLLAALDETSARRMALYKPAMERASTLPEIAQLAREFHAEDLEKGYITVLSELIAGGTSDAEFGREVVARMEPWIDLIEAKIRELLAGSPFESLAQPRDLAYGFTALYLGIDMLTHLEGDRKRAEALLDLGAQLSNLVATFLPAAQKGKSDDDRRN